jgi:hypothetical protein
MRHAVLWPWAFCVKISPELGVGVVVDSDDAGVGPVRCRLRELRAEVTSGWSGPRCDNGVGVNEPRTTARGQPRDDRGPANITCITRIRCPLVVDRMFVIHHIYRFIA